MKIKFLIIILVLCFGNYINVSADITQASLSNVITQIASSSSFTSSAQNTPEAVSEIKSQINSAGLDSAQLEQSVKLMDPREVLKRGYSITTIKGKTISKASKINVGDVILTQTFDAEIESKIIHLKKNT